MEGIILEKKLKLSMLFHQIYIGIYIRIITDGTCDAAKTALKVFFLFVFLLCVQGLFLFLCKGITPGGT